MELAFLAKIRTPFAFDSAFRVITCIWCFSNVPMANCQLENVFMAVSLKTTPKTAAK